MNALGLSPTNKPLPTSPQSQETDSEVMRLHAMLCRYINSSLPPIVISNIHAWVVVAYARRGTLGEPRILLWRHDDVGGPYLPVEDPWDEPDEQHQPWVSAYLPLLQKSFLDAERAEIVGRLTIERFKKQPGLYRETTLEVCAERPEEYDQVAYRTYLVRSSDFKVHLSERGVPESLVVAYRLSPMPRYVWVIEAVDRQLRREGQPDVLGEVLLDATLTQFEPRTDPASLMALHIDNVAQISGVDQGPDSRPSLPRGAVYWSGCPALRGGFLGWPWGR